MDKKLSKLLGAFRKLGLIGNKIEKNTIENTSEISEIIRILMPERLCIYDGETIDEVNSYYSVINAYAEATLGELSIKNINISGDINKKIQIQFEFNESKVIWNISQNGSDFVSDDFIKKLNAFANKNLTGCFFNLPSYDQGIACVYLPKKAVSELKKYLNVIPVDNYVDLFKSHKSCHEQIAFAVDKYGRAIVDSKNSHGETALTAAIKANNSEMAIWGIETNFVPNTLRNNDGKAPLQLAQENGLENVASLLINYLNESEASWEKVLKKHSIGGTEIKGDMWEIINEIVNKKYANIIFPAYVEIYSKLAIGKHSSFQTGSMTIEISEIDKKFRISPTKPYKVIFNPELDGGIGYLSDNLTKEEVVSLVNDFAILSITDE